MIRIKGLSAILLLCLLSMPVIAAQETANQQTNKDEQEAQKRKVLETKVYGLLDELVAGLQTLKLPENRIRTKVNIAKMLWRQDANRARNLFQQATQDLAGLINGISTDDTASPETEQWALALRQEVFQTFLSCDAKLALEFLRSTKPPRNWGNSFDMELEAQVATAAAAKDSEVSLAAARASLVDGFSWHLLQTVNQLLNTDKRAAGKLLDDIAQKLDSEDLLSNPQLSSFAMNILDTVNQQAANSLQRSENDSSSKPADAAASGLPEAPVKKLMEMLIRVALRGNVSINSNDPNEHSITTNLVTWLDSRIPLVEKYAPSLLQELKKKTAQLQQLQVASAPNSNFAQLIESASPEALVKAAATAPKYQRNDYYYQASMKAMNQGDFDLAIEIIENQVQDANLRDQYLQNVAFNLNNSGKMEQARKLIESKISSPYVRNNVLTQINHQKIADDLQNGRLDEVQSLVLRLPFEQRFAKFIEIANALIASGKKEAASQLLERAWNMIPARADNQGQFQAQLSLVAALAPLDLAKATGYTQSIINQLNDMIRAAEMINGFDIRYYKNDELLMQHGLLLSLVQQTGQILTLFAALDFNAAKLLSEQFQRPEAKMQAQLMLLTYLIETLSTPPSVGRGVHRNHRSR
jgi:hypothetical protein